MRNFLVFILGLLIVALFFSVKHDNEISKVKINFSTESSNEDNSGYKYIEPHITRTGKFVKGHIRKPVSTNKNAYKNRARSRYYYETHKNIIKERRRNNE
jgi:hypothetical protein